MQPMKAMSDPDLGMGAVVEISFERAELPSPPHTVAGAPVWVHSTGSARRLCDAWRGSPSRGAGPTGHAGASGY